MSRMNSSRSSKVWCALQGAPWFRSPDWPPWKDQCSALQLCLFTCILKFSAGCIGECCPATSCLSMQLRLTWDLGFKRAPQRASVAPFRHRWTKLTGKSGVGWETCEELERHTKRKKQLTNQPANQPKTSPNATTTTTTTTLQREGAWKWSDRPFQISKTHFCPTGRGWVCGYMLIFCSGKVRAIADPEPKYSCFYT